MQRVKFLENLSFMIVFIYHKKTDNVGTQKNVKRTVSMESSFEHTKLAFNLMDKKMHVIALKQRLSG